MSHDNFLKSMYDAHYEALIALANLNEEHQPGCCVSKHQPALHEQTSDDVA